MKYNVASGVSYKASTKMEKSCRGKYRAVRMEPLDLGVFEFPRASTPSLEQTIIGSSRRAYLLGSQT